MMNYYAIMPKYLKIIIMSGSILLSGCQEELYTDLPENQANVMAAKLMRAGISVEKQRQKNDLITLSVGSGSFAESVEILAASGYPQNQYTDSAQMFKEQGMISSPTEEWARVVYARSQEIAHTISEFEGVILARVHVAVPKKASIIDKPTPPSASVFIKYNQSTDLTAAIPSIKQLVARSIEGLSYQDVSIVMSPGSERQNQPPGYVQFAGLTLHPKSLPQLRTSILLMVIFASGLGGYAVWMFHAKLRKKEA